MISGLIYMVLFDANALPNKDCSVFDGVTEEYSTVHEFVPRKKLQVFRATFPNKSVNKPTPTKATL